MSSKASSSSHCRSNVIINNNNLPCRYVNKDCTFFYKNVLSLFVILILLLLFRIPTMYASSELSTGEMKFNSMISVERHLSHPASETIGVMFRCTSSLRRTVIITQHNITRSSDMSLDSSLRPNSNLETNRRLLNNHNERQSRLQLLMSVKSNDVS